MKRTGVNGIAQVAADNQRSETDRITATIDYVAMMAGIEIPIDEETEESDDEQI